MQDDVQIEQRIAGQTRLRKKGIKQDQNRPDKTRQDKARQDKTRQDQK